MNYAQLLFPDFSLILAGFLVCRFTALNRTVWEQVESLVYYLLFPVLLFQSILKSPLDISAASSLISSGLLLGLAGIAMGLFELLNVAGTIPAQEQFRGQGLLAETLTFAALLFWIVAYTMSRESQRLEKRLGVGVR